ncbi:MAG: hypothetical protein HY685_03055 [Chloroflexi bacterium]|nr:hypothetical protein [Chloroflexota bacterium]
MPTSFDKSRLSVRRLTSADLAKLLSAFEARYKMSSQEFYVKFNTGHLTDKADYLRWATYYDMAAKVGLIDAGVRA